MALPYPSTAYEFIHRFPRHAANTIHTLTEALRTASGSTWTIKHLEACRVIVEPCDTLSALKPYMSDARETVNAEACSAEVRDLMRLTPSMIGGMSHAELRAEGGAFEAFYVALADVLRMLPLAVNNRPQRDCKSVDRPGLVPSSPSRSASSPPEPPTPATSSPPYKPPPEDGGDYDIQLDRTQHEAVSADLAAQFISSVLDHRVSGQTSQTSRIEFSRAPKTFKLRSPKISCTSQDDGSIIRRQRRPLGLKLWTDELFLCSLEAKSRYTQADDSGRSIVSNQVIAQQVCEMLGSVMSIARARGGHENMSKSDRSCFLISTHQATMVFLHADISPKYMAYIYSESPPPKPPYLTIQRSRDFDLEIPEDRKLAAEVIVALTNLFIKEQSIEHLLNE